VILDTNALSALADGELSASSVAAHIQQLSLPVIVLGEFLYGIGRSRHRKRYQAWLEDVLELCPLLSIDGETAASYASVREGLRKRGHPIPSNDAWIAALALQHGLAVLSRDAHFDAVPGVERVEW
jgi:predicted nucleic acid-binding protein